MELWEYPRPKDDTGIGVHWNAGFPNAVGLGKIREFWLPELKAMGIKWVKLLHDGGLEVAQLLLENDIMPIVRLYRPEPNPGTLGPREAEFLERYLDIGVRYFEFNNEPDLGCEWQGGRVPENAIEVVARNAIRDMELILSKGGLPAVPALAVGTKWDLVGKICELGGRDLFEGGVWQAIHNYALNHPLDYPYDAGNQEGQPISMEEYSRLAAEQWDGTAWDNQPLDQINAWRMTDKNPGATIEDDPASFRSYEYFDLLARRALGRSIPILSTENGCAVGERPDRRYPRITPQLHKELHLEMSRIMMGSSVRHPSAPDYYFCTAFWLLGNYALGHWASAWENQAWYSPRWRDGRLPIVDALKAEPKRARPPLQQVVPGPREGVIRGKVSHGAGRVVILTSESGAGLQGVVAEDESYIFSGLPAGRYSLHVEGTELRREEIVCDGRTVVRVNLRLTPARIPASRSQIRGRVENGAGRVIVLRSGEQTWETVADEDGRYRFTGLPAGQYALNVPGTPALQTGLILDGANRLTVNLAVPCWSYRVNNPSGSQPTGRADSVIRCSVEGQAGLPVRLWAEGWDGIVQKTGSKTEYGPYALEFASLPGGTYWVEPEGLGVRTELFVDGDAVAWVEFFEIAPPVSVAAAAEPEPEPALPDPNTLDPRQVRHCLLLGRLVRERESFEALMQYVAAFSPMVSFEPQDARRAEYVTILGDRRSVSLAIEDALRKAGIRVCRIEDWKSLSGLVRRGLWWAG